MSSDETPPLKVTKRGFVFALAIAAFWIIAEFAMPKILGIDLFCREEINSRGRGALVEMVLCTFEAGLPGLLYIGWSAIPIVLFGMWLRSGKSRR